MDTSYGPNLDPATRRRVLTVAAQALGDREPVAGWCFVGGAHADAGAGGATAGRATAGGATAGGGRPALDLAGYKAACVEVAEAGGVPSLCPSAGLAGLPAGELAPAHDEIAGLVDRILGSSFGAQCQPGGRNWTREALGEVLQVPGVVGAKHSSLRREQEWQRL